ncbi:GNAT family N-acetyltransferase, partial [Methanoculleus sp.]|uniref:GNAT family N-acetyltransferase n=1 Tax=Methanoculleus sp. TaxID=90427 RepID=UPI00261E4BA9
LETLQSDREKLATLLDAAVPGSWPPPLLDDEALAGFIRMMTDKTDPQFAIYYWVRNEPAAGERLLIGLGGIASAPTPGTLFIGYSVVRECQGRGYATEAVHQIVSTAFSVPGIRRIMATTHPDHTASIRVLEKNGFRRAGRGFERGTIAFLLEKKETHRV